MELCTLDYMPAPSWPTPLQQHPIYAAALMSLGVKQRVLSWRDGLAAGFVLVQQRRFGPIGFELASRAHVTPAVARALITERERRFDAMALTPETETHVRGALTVTTPAHVAEWDLTSRLAQREASLSGAWRTALKKASRSKVSISASRPNRSTLIETLAHDRTQQRKKGFRALPPSLVLAISDTTPGALRLFRARHKGQTLAEALVIQHAPTATYHIGWTSPQGRETQAMNLLLWEASKTLSDEGTERFDLGLIATDRAPGLARFKIGTGANVRALGATQFCGPLTGVLSRFARSCGGA